MTAGQWLLWAREIQAISQIGLAYAENAFDKHRYARLQALAAEIAAHHLSNDAASLLRSFKAESGYATPKIDVRAICFRDHKLLLVRERSDGLWSLPGGWADVNQTAAESAIRELREESGLEAKVLKLAAVLDLERHVPNSGQLFHVYKMFFVCELIGGEPRPSDETTDVGFFDVSDLPPLSVARVLPSQLARFYEHWRNPALPTDFD